ncbi:MAG TPA: SRPBCC domain-containing protein [Nitrosopumilaceae archaeon]|nr:SRPBCC domain-containing protein [Nitrosopumilaceae archaeon]
MDELIVKKQIKINSSSSKVWEVLINPELTKQYMFGCEIVSDWKVGSPVIWKGAADGKVYVKGTLLAIVTEKFLQFTVFDPNMGIEDIPSNYSTVTFGLSSENSQTILSVSQGDFTKLEEGEKRYNDTVTGWDSVLPKIKDLAEK